jgi:PKD domain/Bacterial Ig-like domain
MRRVGGGLFGAVLLVVVLAAAGPVSSAFAEPPSVKIRVPSTVPETPTIEGSAGLVAEGDNPDVSVVVSHRGGSVVGSATVPVEQFSREWECKPSEYTPTSLSDGEYEVVATQGNELGETGEARAVFKVEAAPPVVTISVPTPKPEPKPTLGGEAGTAESVSVAITGKLTNGESAKEIKAGAQVSEGKWSYTVAAPGLADGEYTAEVTGTTKSGAKASAHASFKINTPLPPVTLGTTTFVQREKGELATNATPSFTGTAATGAEDEKTVTVNLYKGTTPTGTPVKVSGTATGTTWAAGPAAALTTVPGTYTYTAQASQEDKAKNVGVSAPVTFTVDIMPPKVAVTKPASKEEVKVSKPVFSGSAGIEKGDLPSVTLKIYQGTSATGSPAQTLTILPSGATWAEAGGPRFTNGTYTVVAEQSDDVGNIGKSTPTTFTIFTKSPSVTQVTGGLVLRGATIVSGPSPSFSGSAGNAPEDSSAVTVNLYSGTSATGNPVRSVQGGRSGTSWSAGPAAALPAGTYTAQAEQTALPPQVTGFSNTSTFTVDATPPQVTLTSLASGSSTTSGSELVTGSAGTSPGDLPAITVQLFSGTGTAGALVQSINVNAVGQAWSATVAGLGPGTYTVRAQQSDDVGNVGFSPAATFTVTGATSSISHPLTAAFSWVPSAPHTGEPVSLLSSSTDVASPITAFAWDLAGSGAFTPGASVISTSFSTPGQHLVQLRVTDAIGLSSVAGEAIPVTGPVLPLMRPFPIVRIVASYSASAVRLKVLSVQAPAGARISVLCRGHGCPLKSQTRVAAAGKVGKAPVVFRRFERSLRAGVALEVRVSKPGQIGKYTRFAIRHGKLPTRLDRCLGPAGGNPIACPSS